MRVPSHLRVLFIICIAMTLILAIVQVSAAEDQKLVAYWALDEGSGTIAYDQSGNGYDGTVYGGPARTAGVSGTAIDFQRSGIFSGNDYVKAPNVFAGKPSQFTVMAWAKPRSDMQDSVIVSQSSGPSTGKCYLFAIWIAGAKNFYFSVNNGGDTGDNEMFISPISSAIPTADTWYHLTGVFTGTTVKLYVNGQLDSDLPYTGELCTPDLPIEIGKKWNQNWWNGLIDEVKIYNYALSASEIYQQYDVHTCADDCSPSGTNTCSELGYKTCGNYDADSCLEWSNVTSCAAGQTCSNGACVATPCTDDCSASGTKTCSGIGYKTCGNYDADSCLEWSDVTSCASGMSCQEGVCIAQAQKLLAYWPFNEGTGTTAYDQAGTYNAPISGATWTTGACGKALSFDGVDDHVKSGYQPTSFSDTTALTISMWFKTTATTTSGLCCYYKGYSENNAGQMHLMFNPADGNVNWHIRDRVTASASEHVNDISSYYPAYDDGNWHHVAAVRQTDSTMLLYMDGVKLSSAVSTDIPLATYDHELPWYIGGVNDAYHNRVSNPWNGLIDEVKIYNYALSASEIQQEYARCSPPACTNDCSPSGTKTCSGLGYKTCGNYDADSCLDWSNVTNCGPSEACAGGACTVAVVCGNGLCDTGENCAACAGDCACGASQLCCSQQCVLPACRAAGDCNDGNALTTDACSNTGTCSAACTNQPCTVRCSSDSQCNDGSSTTTDTCSNSGTCSASCKYEMCTIICTSNANCDDANPNTADTCSNPGTCSASCVHAQNPNYANNGVCDVNVGESCLSAPGDCACAAGQLCKHERTTNVNGCARTECGDGYLDPGEENCCADAGCGPGLFCDWAANVCVACRTDNDCEVGYCTAHACVECRSNTDCESGLCEAGACVECLVDKHCSARRIWDSSPECTSDQHSVFQRGKMIEGICNENTHKCVGQEKVIQRNVRDCSPDYCQDGKCGCADGFFACKAAKGCVAKNGLENGEACGCDEQCTGGVCQGGLCRAPSLNLSAKKPNLKMGEENEIFFSIQNPFDEEIEFTIMLSVGAGVDVSKVLACDEAIGSLCKVTRRLLPGASTSLSLGVLPQSLEQSVSVQGTVAYTYRDKTLEMSQEMSLGSEGGVEIVEMPVKTTGVKRLLESTLFTVVVATLLATTGIGYVYRNRLTIGAKIEDLLDSLRHDRQERREFRPGMPNREEVEAEEQLKNYILKARAKGHSDEAIREALLKKGWDSQQVENWLKRK